MKRLNSSHSFNGLQGKPGPVPVSLSVEEKGKYEAVLDGTEELDGCEQEELCGTGQSGLGEKKRRLSVEQVKALEKNFEVENKLDPERKLRLAQDLGLQPRQVAVWFQNRRARWKTKQLERDHGALKARHEALKLDCDALGRDNEALLAEITELKAKLADSGVDAMESETKAVEEERPPLIHKDGASDSDSSVVFNDETSPRAGTVLHQRFLTGFRSQCPSLPLPFEDKAQAEKGYLDEELLAGEELCSSLFSEQQAPNFSWYCSDEWD
ncbi:hypothetical protein MUK42_28020 [Musa troglodytarum]|uniref:Homeobox-leucine zipper protein n=1 Tax=Musa troglodytarum TaxID=320322 RepID=A0A9E7F0N6_9LILI|nr:hypothetical protein MUK42_28020 [Musa troglodytarum]URD86317.1 hypothetical protein MUK42_28020 [Musa troglodytarum]